MTQTGNNLKGLIKVICESCREHRGSEHRGSEHRGSEHRGSEHRGSEHRGSEHRGSEHRGSDCFVCSGRRYYLWDPQSLRCFGADGTAIRAVASDGQTMDVVRSLEPESGSERTRRDKTGSKAKTQRKSEQQTADQMLDYFARWAKRDPRRRFKLWYEGGWNCYAWPNSLKPGVCSSQDEDIIACLEKCLASLKSSAKSATPKNKKSPAAEA